MTTVKTENAVIVPDIFLSDSDETADGYVLIVEGMELNVSMGGLAFHSKPLKTTMFNTDFRNAEEGKVDLKGNKLCDVVPLLCWVFHEEDPNAGNKTYGAIGKERGIANEDLPALIVLADEWEMKRLLKACLWVYRDFADKGFETKETAVLALKIMVALDSISLMEEGIPDQLINAGIYIDDIDAVGIGGPLRDLLLKKFVSKGLYENKAEALKALDFLDSLAERDGLGMTVKELRTVAYNLINAGITIDDMDANITSKHPMRIPFITMFAERGFANKAAALKALTMLEGLGMTEEYKILDEIIRAGVSDEDIDDLAITDSFRIMFLKVQNFIYSKQTTIRFSKV